MQVRDAAPSVHTMESLSAEAITIEAQARVEDALRNAGENAAGGGGRGGRAGEKGAGGLRGQEEGIIDKILVAKGEPATARQEMVHMLMAVTGIEDAEFAREFLQDNGWQLEPAVNQFMVMTEDGGGAGGGVPMAASPREAPAPSIPARPDPGPAPPVVQRLVDDMPGVDGPAQESVRNFAAEGRSFFSEPLVFPQAIVECPAGHAMEMLSSGSSWRCDVCKTSQHENPRLRCRRCDYDMCKTCIPSGCMAVAQSSAAAPEKLDYLFPPPADIMFQGSFDALRKAAEDEEKYCLVNIQKRQEFSSQMLNRDTWPDDTVRTIMGFRFVFWQQEYESVAGMQYLSCYPAATLPLVDIVDPITGGLLERIEEYQTAEQMVERLTRFIDSHQWGKMGISLSMSCPQVPLRMHALTRALFPVTTWFEWWLRSHAITESTQHNREFRCTACTPYCSTLTPVNRAGKVVVPTSNFSAPQHDLHSMSGMAQGPSAVSDGGGAFGGGDYMDRSTRMSLESEDAVRW